MNYFAKNLRALRESKGIKQLDVAFDLNINRARISDYENGKTNPNINTLILLSDYFSVSIDDLLKKNLDRIDVLSKINL